jgi:hypothetical protein
MKVTIAKWLTLVVAILVLASPVMGFNPPKDTAGPLTVAIEAPDKVGSLDAPFDVTVTLANASSATLEARLEVWVIDDWKIEPDKGRRMEKTVQVAGGGSERVALKLTAGAGTYNAHYPIHARVTFADPVSKESRQAHAIKICSVNLSREDRKAEGAEPVTIKGGMISLLQLRPQSVALALGEGSATRTLGVDWRGTDAETGAVFEATSVDRGKPLPCFAVHPPWRTGWGNVWADYDLTLPDVRPIAFTYSAAIRDDGPNEPPSDGVYFQVFVGPTSRSLQALHSTFTKSKRWGTHYADLSPFAGQRITLRLWAGPGAYHNTVCDTGYWGNPMILLGDQAKQPSFGEPERRCEQVLRLAREARAGKLAPWSWRITSEAGDFGVAVEPSPEGGLFCGPIGMNCGSRNFLFTWFEIQIDGQRIPLLPMAEPLRWEGRFEQGRGILEATLFCGGQPTRVRQEVWVEKGALRFRFTMPDVKRDKGGHPRFTLLGLGPAYGGFHLDHSAIPGDMSYTASYPRLGIRRVYAGFGNVIEKPQRFDLSSNGFNLSTRHVGVDYDNGLSLVQATDVFPDRLHVDPEQLTWSLQTHHDATISLIPSEKGAFAAAKVYREGIAGFKPAPGVVALRGKMCLDYWGTSYQHGIDTVEKLAKYGVTDCVYVWHNWQRWGYDYRLPEIYPARGSHEEFLKLAQTCRKNGLLFAPHDNYIDFYPDAEGYSYDHIIFNEDGTPQRAWFNKGRNAQSYRWLPHAFRPWLEKNIALLKKDVKPTAYFIDVFTAIEPMDYYDYTGRFHPKTETIRRWGDCFDYVREQFGGAPQISEAGSDHLIGHLDAGESDHNGVSRKGSQQWLWNVPCGDWERTPWHDMASHGSFILFGGGLSSRYVNEEGRRPGYGSDDYLSLTVLGGRNPMAQGDSSAETILTYWLLHDICAELGKRPMTSHEFADGNVHRQIVHFGDEATVWVNRGKEDWKVGDAILPQYGFMAKAGDVRAEVARRDGVACGYAESGNVIFVDARPPRPSRLESNKDRKVVDFGMVSTNGVFRMAGDETTWRIVMLSGCPASEIRLHLSRMPKEANPRVAKIEKLNDDGAIAGPVEFKESNGDVVFQTSAGDFGFRVTRR